MIQVFNLALHLHLLATGYTHEHHEATWEDDGDGESGPHLTGGPAFDLYTSDTDYVYMSEDGHFDTELRDLAAEQFYAEMEMAQSRTYLEHSLKRQNQLNELLNMREPR